MENKKIVTIEEINRKRLPGEEDLTEYLYEHLQAELGVKVANRFLNTTEIKSIVDKNPVLQKFIINRLLVATLFKLRARKSIKVYNIIIFFGNDLELDDWKTIVSEVFINFIKMTKTRKDIFKGNK